MCAFDIAAWQKAQREKRATEPQKVLEDTQGVTLVSDERMAELHDYERKYKELVANLEQFMADLKGEQHVH